MGGRVVRYIGTDHAPDICSPACALDHAYAFVRCPAQSLAASAAAPVRTLIALHRAGHGLNMLLTPACHTPARILCVVLSRPLRDAWPGSCACLWANCMFEH